MLDITKISSKGQITIPVELRKRLNLALGGKVAFVEGQDGMIYLVNPSLLALKTAQKAFQGSAKEAGIQNEDELIALMKSEE